jgi:hypothetical protein
MIEVQTIETPTHTPIWLSVFGAPTSSVDNGDGTITHTWYTPEGETK